MVTGRELQVDAPFLAESCPNGHLVPNGPKICASVWTCGAESEAERWNRASGVKSAAERRDASPDGSQREAATSARFGDRNGQRRAGEGRLLSVEGAKMSVGRGGEN